MDKFFYWLAWAILAVLGIKYSIEWTTDNDIGWKAPIIILFTFQHIFLITKGFKTNENK